VTVLYCVVQADAIPAPPSGGLPEAGAPRALSIGGSLYAIAATVSDKAYAQDVIDAKLRDVDWVSQAAIGHEALIEAVMASAPTVLPMKLLTLFSSDERLAKDLKARRKPLERAAARVAGCREYGLRVVAMGAPADTPGEPGDRPSSGLAFLERKKQVRDVARDRASARLDFAREAYTALAAAARDAVQRPVVADEAERPLLDAAFLVAPENTAAFARASEDLAARAAQAHCVFTLTGPWPAYHFVTD
jgi:hypothetical protein